MIISFSPRTNATTQLMPSMILTYLNPEPLIWRTDGQTANIQCQQRSSVPAGDELAAWRRADGLNVVVLQRHALRRQLVQSGSLDGRVVVADVVEALI